MPRVLLAVFILLLASCALIIETRDWHAAIHLRVNVAGFEPAAYRVFYDRGAGFRQEDSRRAVVPSPMTVSKLVRKKDLLRYLPGYDFDSAALYIPLPGAAKLRGLRIQFDTPAAAARIQNICLLNRRQARCWEGASLQSGFSQEARYLEYQGDFAALYQDFQFHDWKRKSAWYLLIVFSGAVLWWWLNQFAGERRRYLHGENFTPAKIFILLALPLGLLCLLLTPPFQVSDETLHFMRGAHLSEGKLLSEKHTVENKQLVGLSIPAHAAQATADLFSYYFYRENPHSFAKLQYYQGQPPLAYETRFLVTHSLYPPLPYAPQAGAIALGRMLDWPWLYSMYLGRFSALLTWVILVSLAVRLIPVNPWLLTLFALTPMMLYQAASHSADSLTNALALLSTALILRAALREELSLRSQLPLILSLLALLSLCKQPYAVLSLLLFLIPPARFGGLKNYLLFFGALPTVVIGLIFAWLFLIQDVYSVFQKLHQSRLSALLAEPSLFPALIAATLKAHGAELLHGFIGILGYHNVPLPLWAVLPHWFMLFLYAAGGGARREAGLYAWRKGILGGTFVLGVLLIFSAMYFSWVPPTAGTIEGLQGRYFLPLGLLFLLLFYNREFILEQKRQAWGIILYLPLLYGVLYYTLITNYYC